jgi:signal transduction histidine kinase
MIFNIGLPVFLNVTHLYFFGDYSTIFLLGFTTYAIVRHELFDIKILATEIMTIIIWIILFTKIFASQSIEELITDLTVFGIMIVFGNLLVKSVRREVEQRRELEVLNQKLEELDKQKDEFLNIASHELRAPMSAIKGYISMTQAGDGGEIPVAAQELLSEAANENDRMIRLVNNMLNVARIEEGRMVYEVGEVKLSAVVGLVFDEFKFDAQNKALKYVYEPSPGIADKVEVDVDRIHEVVSNLINNAIKYTDSGKVEVRLLNPAAGRVRFEVEDTGAGMTQDEIGKLFQKFYRAGSYVGKVMGTGLGLYISKLLVEKFGGTIGVKSEKGKGSLFWFELPVRT